MKKDMVNHKLLNEALHRESQQFREYYLWLEKAMPPLFFEEVSRESLLLITHNLMGFSLQDFYSTIHLKNEAIVLCLDGLDTDLRTLHHYTMYGIRSYQGYVSSAPLPFNKKKSFLRVVVINFTEAIEISEKPFADQSLALLRRLSKERNPLLTDFAFDQMLTRMSSRFLHSLPLDSLVLALDMIFRAETRDNCQYEVRYHEDWKRAKSDSMQIVLAWRNTPKQNFLYRLAQVIHRHGLVMKRVNATYIDPYKRQNILVMAIGLHGSNGKAAWEAADISDFLRELATVKYFTPFDRIDDQLVSQGLISGNVGNLLRAAVSFIHQALVHIDANLYTLENIEEGLCRHPELTVKLCQAFAWKFDPHHDDHEKFLKVRQEFLNLVDKLDTGQEENDTRRKNVLFQAMNFFHHILKTNFYRLNFTAISFRVDPNYLNEIPFNRIEKFPEMPYGIFFMKGMHFFGFHIRFKDLARGGLRTVCPSQVEYVSAERNNIFTECYNLALTQQKKNKDIPEGGAKGIIFLKPFERLDSEMLILQRELEEAKIDRKEIEEQISTFRQEQKVEFLYQAQRSFIESLITIINCDPDGLIRAKNIVDYWKRPEYLYLGPDENMHDFMIQWIAEFSKKYDYKPGSAFISSKPTLGINHKEYGVTSLGLNVYMHQVLEYMGINPSTDRFTVKMSGGPDGDVAGNQLLNLYKYYPNTAKVVALTDGSGTIHDENGLDLGVLKDLFHQSKGIHHYPPELLSNGGFLVDKSIKRYQTPLAQQILCWRKVDGNLHEEWISGSEMNHLCRSNVHQTKADIFIPAGGRPRTLNETNVRDYLDETGKPTSRAIVEGANLYLTPAARQFLEQLGVLIIKDSSANKTGVICSSFEVLCGLTLGEELFLKNKKGLVEEILETLKECAYHEAVLLLKTHKKTGAPLTEISEKISERINKFTYELLDYLDRLPLSNDPNDPLVQCFLSYCPSLLRNQYQNALLREIPDHHKKAIIACYLSVHCVYQNGLEWYPSIVDILPILLMAMDKNRLLS
jgi:glutamate dehydrogenase